MAFGYYKTFTTDHTQAGSADTANFPITISVTDADLKTVANGGKVQNSSGFDIRPYSDAGLTSALTFQLVFYDGTNGILEMHVLVSNLSVSSDLVSYLAFGDSGISTDGSSTSTWDSNFVGVYHFKDGTTLSVADGSQAGNNGTAVNTPTAVAGQIDGGIDMVRSSNQYVNLGNPSSLQITGDITIEGWINFDGVAVDKMIIAKDKDTGGRAYTLDFATATKKMRVYINGGSGADLLSGTTSLSGATWYRYMATWKLSNKAITLRLNGAADGSSTTTTAAIPSATADCLIGRRQYSGFESNFDGIMDEVRISNVVRSTSYDTATYNNQKTSSTFLTWGSATAVGSSFHVAWARGVNSLIQPGIIR